MKKNWFSIIEILIWIFIFSLGLVSVYSLLSSTLRINTYNENAIIASNLAREQLEMVRNIRDNNYKKLQKFNTLNPDTSHYDQVLEIGKYYTIENNYTTGEFPIKIEDITQWFGEWENKLNTQMKAYQLYFDQNHGYVLNSLWNKKTPFYRYITVNKVEDGSGVIHDALKITSKVIWYQWWYHDFEIKTIIADWKRL